MTSPNATIEPPLTTGETDILRLPRPGQALGQDRQVELVEFAM